MSNLFICFQQKLIILIVVGLTGVNMTALAEVKTNMQLENQMPFDDQNFACIDQATANSFIIDFRINFISFGGLELCDNSKDTKKLFNDLALIKNGQFDQSKANQFIQGFIDPKNYYSWMKSQTKSISRGNDIPKASAYNRGGMFTMQDGWAKSSTLGRVGTIIHEARHTAGYTHIPCLQGAYKNDNMEACDAEYSYGGSHAVEMEYYANVAVRGLNFHPVYKKMARLMAMARSNFLFNKPVMQSRESLLLLLGDRQSVQMLDENVWTTKEISQAVSQTAGILKRTSYGAALFNGIVANSIDLYQNSGFNVPVRDAYSYFKLLEDPVKDFEEFDVNNKRYVFKVTLDNELVRFIFSKGSWGQPQKILFNLEKISTVLPGSKVSGLYLISDRGEIFEVNPETMGMTLLNIKWDLNVLKIVQYQDTQLLLKKDGFIYDSKTDLKWTASKQYQDMIMVPVYDIFDVIKN